MKGAQGFLNGSLKRMLLLFLCASLGLTLLLTALSASVYHGVMRSNTAQTVGLYVSEQQKLLEDEMQNIKTALYSLINKQEVADYLGGGTGYKAANAKYINSLLADVTAYVPSVSDIALAGPDGRFTAISNNKSDMRNFLLRYELLRRYAREGRTGPAWFTVEEARDGEQFLLALIVPVQAGRQTALAAAFCTANSLLRRMSLFERPFALCDGERVVYRSADFSPQGGAGAALGQETPPGFLRFDAETAGWHVLIESPFITEEDSLAAEMLRWNAIAFLIFLLIECGLILAVYRTIIAPIASISAQSARINSSAAHIDNPAPGRTELNALVHNINAMVGRAAALAEEVNRAKLRLMEMDILRLKEKNMFLQAQINPHFLYNMLECICGMATAQGCGSIREMTQLLARLYRYCLQSPESTLGEELECVAVYERIIRLRYDREYAVQVQAAEELLPLPLPRMVLEPLVENAVQHGFVRGSDRVFFVRIGARLQENEMEITIEDNGCGVPAERLRQINQRLSGSAIEQGEKDGQIGIYNVGTRLRLIYGPGSGLTLEKNPLGGLTVRMRVLYSLEEENEGGSTDGAG